MTQLTQKEIDAVEELMNIFKSEAGYCNEILRNKFFPEKAREEIDYIFRDIKSENTNRLFSLLTNLHERTKEE